MKPACREALNQPFPFLQIFELRYHTPTSALVQNLGVVVHVGIQGPLGCHLGYDVDDTIATRQRCLLALRADSFPLRY